MEDKTVVGAVQPVTTVYDDNSKSDGAVIQQQPTAGQPPAAQPTAPPYYSSNPQAPPANIAAVPPAYPGGAVPPSYTQEAVPPGFVPPGAVPPGYPPGTTQPGVPYPQTAAGQPPIGYQPGPGQPGVPGALATNLPPPEVVWMPPPSNTPSSCPPGLEYLTEIDQVLVHQQIEILELITNYETENKYRIRNTLGQQIYFATEQSSVFQRQCCGPGRAFSMSITDNSQREVIHLERPQRVYWNCSGAVCYCCCSCCLPHTIEVQAPPGTVVGYVKQEALGILNPWFSILNADGETVLRMKGPTLGCSCYSDADFFVLSSDGTQEVGKISKQWGGLAKEYFTDADNFGIQFPMDLDVKMKAVMLGACFLIDFMFFESPGASQGGHNRGGFYYGAGAAAGHRHHHHHHRHRHHHHHRRRHGRRH